MKILIASDKFKGSMTAGEACRAISRGVARAGDEIRIVPVADGGDGMARALTDAQSGEWIEMEVQGPLGEPVLAGYGLLDDGATAVIEMAEASGLAILGSQPLDPWRASTFGTGQLICDAMERGVGKVLLGIGGSATNDGGTGMAKALGYRFFNGEGEELEELPERLGELARIEAPAGIESFPEVVVACDVTNPLLGPQGCTAVYGPQKGIIPSDSDAQESRLKQLVSVTDGESFAEEPGSGAAGGLGFGAKVFLKAKLVPGFDLVADVLNLPEAIEWADLVITGEGKIDGQSLQGKAPAGVAALARNYRKRVVAFCGLLGEGDFSTYFDQIWEIDRGALSVEESMQQGDSLLEKTARKAELW
ncbi:MAG: glycerate kinase [Verrucomicrobiales bacterium]|nr:glycerate kinase [Verrucomicrobiales bacterium]